MPRIQAGCSLSGSENGGRWTPVEAQHHINYLELKAVFLASQSFLKTKNGITVLIRSDNCASIVCVNKMGGSAMTQLCSLALRIWQWCLARQITPHAEYGTNHTQLKRYTRVTRMSYAWSEPHTRGLLR